RTAGAVPDVLAVAGGHSLIRYGLLAALEAVEPGGLLPCPVVGYRINVQPPTWARRVRTVAGLDRLPGAPTVQSVNLLRKDGDAVDWRLGTDEMVVAVVGAAASMDELADVRRRVLATISIDYE
ncbi:MAG TPA: hypothetical protein VKW77_06980, partial [Acidimicrobiales bacterium]|nr:hypothetical protein [Acidimicrobiales bacterium]